MVHSEGNSLHPVLFLTRLKILANPANMAHLAEAVKRGQHESMPVMAHDEGQYKVLKKGKDLGHRNHLYTPKTSAGTLQSCLFIKLSDDLFVC